MSKKALQLLPQSIRTAFTRETWHVPLSLFEAVLYEDRHGLTQLLEGGADSNAIDYIGRTPLHIAVASGDLEAAQILLEHGANPNFGTDKVWSAPPLFIAARGDFGVNPLHRKRFGKYTHMLRLLLRHNANPNPNSRGRMAMHVCAACGFTAGMEALLVAKALLHNSIFG